MNDNLNPRDEERARQEAAKLAERKKMRDRDDYSWLMSDPRGRRLMWDWLGSTGLYRTSFHSSGSVTSFNEGQRNIGLMLNAAVMEHCPEQWAVMQSEAIAK